MVLQSMFNILIFALYCFALVVSLWIASLECFNGIDCKDVLDISLTAFDKGRDFSLRS